MADFEEGFNTSDDPLTEGLSRNKKGEFNPDELRELVNTFRRGGQSEKASNDNNAGFKKKDS